MKVDRRLTEHNPNVFYELAIRHAKRKAVVLLIQKGQRIPFDVAPNRVIHYDTADWNSPGQCVNELKQQIEAVLKDPLAAYNPISAAIDFLALRGSSDPFKQIVAEILPRLQALEVTTTNIQANLDGSLYHVPAEPSPLSSLVATHWVNEFATKLEKAQAEAARAVNLIARTTSGLGLGGDQSNTSE